MIRHIALLLMTPILLAQNQMLMISQKISGGGGATITRSTNCHQDANAGSVTITCTVTASNALLVGVGTADNTHTVSSVVCGTNTLTKLVGTTSPADKEIWGIISAASCSSIVVTISSSGPFNVDAQQYIGPVHFGNTTTATASNANGTISLTMQDTNNWMYGYFAATSGGAGSAVTGTLNVNAYNSAQGSVIESAMDNTQPSTGSLTTALTFGSTPTWYAAAVELRTQ